MESNTVINLERDLQILEASATDLKSYLLSDKLFWTLSRADTTTVALPKGTLGGLLIRLHRLQACRGDLEGAQVDRFAVVSHAVSGELDHWLVQAESKSQHDLKSRLHNWTAYLEELAENPARYAPEYPTQVEGRTIIELLISAYEDAARQAGVATQIAALDMRLTELTDRGAFAWHEDLRGAFPEGRFWWLYREPRLSHGKN